MLPVSASLTARLCKTRETRGLTRVGRQGGGLGRWCGAGPGPTFDPAGCSAVSPSNRAGWRCVFGVTSSRRDAFRGSRAGGTDWSGSTASAPHPTHPDKGRGTEKARDWSTPAFESSLLGGGGEGQPNFSDRIWTHDHQQRYPETLEVREWLLEGHNIASHGLIRWTVGILGAHIRCGCDEQFPGVGPGVRDHGPDPRDRCV